MSESPLSGIKVVELARILAGPWAGQVLADLGAEVHKVEGPDGDDTRQWGPPFIDRPDGSKDAAYFHAANRGKDTMVADFKRAADLKKVQAMIAEADVVIENFKPGTLEKWGLSPEALLAENPGLIIARMSGYGQTGPYSNRAGFGGIGEAMGGWRYIVGDEDRPPARMGVSIGDTLCASYGCMGVLAALHHRE